MNAKLCPECGNICTSLQECLKLQEFMLVVEDAKAIAKLKKHITSTVPHFKGIKKWLQLEPEGFQYLQFNDTMQWQYRFLTITFSPKKFTFNELTQPQKLINYALNALKDLKNLFKGKPIIVIEYHKSGIPHIHLNYSTETPLEQSTLLLRLNYYFAESLRNKRCIHDRIFNEGGKQYITKSNTHFYTFE